GEGEMILLLHGWLDHAGSFDLLAPLLPGRTVALDFRGHGDSQWAGPGGFYHFVEYIADLDGALEILSPQEPVPIVGYSMGALAWKWDPLLRAHSPLPISEPVLQLVCAQATTPILVIRGETGMLPHEPELRARFPHLKMSVQTVPGAGHHVHLDAPEEVANLVRASR